MQKYKIVASKSQKKYTIIISADSEQEAKEKLHKEGYSILSVEHSEGGDISGKKFLFQVERKGDIKNGIIIGEDIFKVYVKLRDELGYNVLYLYPEGDEAHESSEKKQKIIEQLQSGYDLQKKNIKIKSASGESEESFYMKKQLDETYTLIEKAIEKFDRIFNNRADFSIDDETFYKLERVYEKLVHIKGSTNLSKLKEIGELALIKVAKIELQKVEESKNKESRELLRQTNMLLKRIGSSEQFIEEDKDIKKKILGFFLQLKKALSFEELKNDYKKNKANKELIDKESYSFLKTVLLLEKYKDKLSENTKDIQKNLLLFLNPFSSSPIKEKLRLKRKVIKQNISLLKAKKSGGIGSYTGIKKGYTKITEGILSSTSFLGKSVFAFLIFYIGLFLGVFLIRSLGINIFDINTHSLVSFLLFFILFLVLSISKNTFLLGINIVFFTFIFIFSTVNF